MSEELVLVPLWRRPGFAEAALRCLALAADDNVYVRLLLDEGYDHAMREVIRRFGKIHGRTFDVVVNDKRRMRGNSENILKALEQAATGAWDLVHIVEEDVLVSTGYFAYHRQAHALAPNAFAVSACRNHNGRTMIKQADTVWRHPSYQSLGVSLRPEVVRSVVPHVTAAYFRDPVAYCAKTFPHSKIPAPHAEQDGLLNRLRERAGMYTVYPCLPRAYHAGFTGYNRSGIGELVGTPEQQADTLLTMSSADLNMMASHRFRDHETSDLALDFPVTRIVD